MNIAAYCPPHTPKQATDRPPAAGPLARSKFAICGGTDQPVRLILSDNLYRSHHRPSPIGRMTPVKGPGSRYPMTIPRTMIAAMIDPATTHNHPLPFGISCALVFLS